MKRFSLFWRASSSLMRRADRAIARTRPLLLFIAGVSLFLAPGAHAQTKTIVSATVVDPNGVPYAGGSVATQLVPTGGTPTINHVPVNVQNNPAAIDANGHFTISLWCNTAGGACTPLDQSGTQWQFTITNPGAQPPVGFGGVSFTVSVTITGTTQDISSTLNAAAVLLYRDGGTANGCTVSGAAGNLLYVNSAVNGCANSNKLNYNSGTDALNVLLGSTGVATIATGPTTANGIQISPSTVLVTALETGGQVTFTGDVGISFSTNGAPGDIIGFSSPTIQENAGTIATRAGPAITDTVGSASPVTPGSVTQRSVTITSDTILNTDRGNRVVYNSASAVAVSLPANGSSGFSGGMNFRLSNQNTGVVTVTPAAGTINGSATLVLSEGQDCFFTPSSAGTSWAADCNEPQITAGTGISLTRGVHSLTISNTGGTVTSVSGTANQINVATGTTTPVLSLSSTLLVPGTFTSSTAGALSTPSVVINGAAVTGGTGTTTTPLVSIGNGAAAATWSTNGTLLGLNAGSGFTGNPVDIHINGGVSIFSINSSGTVAASGTLSAGASSVIGFFGRSAIDSSADGLLRLRNSAGNGFTRLQFGGTTSSFAAVASSGTALSVTLADGTAGGTLTAGNLAAMSSCGTTSTCANTAVTTNAKIIFGSAALVSGTPSAVTITGISPAFTSTTSYKCTVSDQTTVANSLFTVTYVSGSSFTITGGTALTDTVGYMCAGN